MRNHEFAQLEQNSQTLALITTIEPVLLSCICLCSLLLLHMHGCVVYYYHACMSVCGGSSDASRLAAADTGICCPCFLDNSLHLHELDRERGSAVYRSANYCLYA